MPLYKFTCPDCGKTIEVIMAKAQARSDEVTCPSCRADPKIARLVKMKPIIARPGATVLKAVVLILLAASASASSLEQRLVANYLGLGLRDVHSTARLIGTRYVDHGQLYECAEINPVARRLIGNGGPERIKIVGLAGIATGYLAYRAAPRRLRLPVLIALNVAEAIALGSWGASATLNI
jgi:putative FmdB family regulatory protein